MRNMKIKKWNQSYLRGENNILYPQVEVIRFVNKFIGKKVMKGQTEILLDTKEEDIKCLDFACGVGIHAIAVEEFGFISYGVDISEVAIDKAKVNALQKGNKNLGNRFSVLDKNYKKLPFSDKFFDFSIAESCLDYMTFENAKYNFEELKRVTKHYIYFSLAGASSNNNISEQKLSTTKHQEGLYTCYFDKSLISMLIGCDINNLVQINRVVQTEEIKGTITNERFYGVYKCI